MPTYSPIDLIKETSLTPLSEDEIFPGADGNFYLIYKTTNCLDGKFYKGQHKTKKLKDNYLGSGTRIWLAVLKYGRPNFKREIIGFYENFKDMDEAEKLFITEEDIKNKNCYNIRIGGHNQYWFTSSEEKKKEIRDRLIKRLTGRIVSQETRDKLRNNMKGKPKTAAHRAKIAAAQIGKTPPMVGREHTQESINKMKENSNRNPNSDATVMHTKEAIEKSANSRTGTNWILNEDGIREYYLPDPKNPGLFIKTTTLHYNEKKENARTTELVEQRRSKELSPEEKEQNEKATAIIILRAKEQERDDRLELHWKRNKETNVITWFHTDPEDPEFYRELPPSNSIRKADPTNPKKRKSLWYSHPTTKIRIYYNKGDANDPEILFPGINVKN